ncbi:hypothetical protein C0585_04855 [Candidatus Woesearchaeota archaeon]|nr:MAG: hypothetical protein C0585_04855 [Candidatus Woesearchaeota archaeon]
MSNKFKFFVRGYEVIIPMPFAIFVEEYKENMKISPVLYTIEKNIINEEDKTQLEIKTILKCAESQFIDKEDTLEGIAKGLSYHIKGTFVIKNDGSSISNKDFQDYLSELLSNPISRIMHFGMVIKETYITKTQ